MATNQQENKYKVQSLERGLLILRELHSSNAPVRNQDLVKRTQLPKATVSRLLNTLTALGCVRRIDMGSYVLDHASGRSGRALISSLELEKYSGLLSQAPGPVFLEAIVSGNRMPVYRWHITCGPLSNGSGEALVPDENRYADSGEYWDKGSSRWWVWTSFQLKTVGNFSLTLQASKRTSPEIFEIENAHHMLSRVVTEIIASEIS